MLLSSASEYNLEDAIKTSRNLERQAKPDIIDLNFTCFRKFDVDVTNADNYFCLAARNKQVHLMLLLAFDLYAKISRRSRSQQPT